MASTPESFLELLEKSKLLTPEQLAEAQTAARDNQEPKALAKALVQQELLTRWQAAQLLAGRSSFFLGKYKLIELLGRGGMGGVFLAEHTMMNRAVALKIIPRQLGRDPALLERFLTEARAIAALDHPNIVHAYNVDNEGDRYYLVMEFVEGQDLRRMVEAEGPLDFRKAVDYTRQTADGLAHAHGRNMIHCDIKPGNLLVNRQGVVKILDMGMARLVGPDENGQGEQNDRVLGTVDYMAPEQALQGPDLDHRVDIYSLGCTLYFVLTGRPPFPDGTIPERIMRHQTQEPRGIVELRPGVPADLVEICRKMMAKDPAARYQTAEEVSKVLAEWRPPPPRLKRAVPLEEHDAAGAAEVDFVASGTAARVVRRKPPRDRIAAVFADRRRMMWFGGIGLAVLLVLGTLLTWLVLAKLSRHRPATTEASQSQTAEGTDAKRAKRPADSRVEGQERPDGKAAPDKNAKAESDTKRKPEEKASASRLGSGKPGADKLAAEQPKPPEQPEKKPEPPKPLDKPQEPAKPPQTAAPSADPFKDFPKAVDLPEEQAELAKILTDASWELELVGGDKVLKGNRQFLPLERKDENGKTTWPVRVSAAVDSGEPAEVAKFLREGQSLQFQWVGKPTPQANQLRLCALTVRAGSGETRSLALFHPQAAKPAELVLDRVATVTQVPLTWLPESSRLRIQLTKLEGLQDYVIHPTEPVAHNGKVVVSFSRKDARTKAEQPALALTVTFGVKSPSTLTINVRLPDMNLPPPIKTLPGLFKWLSGLGVKAGLEDQLSRANKELEKKGGLQAPKKRMLEIAADDLGAKVWLADFYNASKTARLHYRVFAEVGDQLVEVAGTPASPEPEKKGK